MRHVYRMENKQGLGPFNPGVSRGSFEKFMAVFDAWSHVSWADPSLGGLSAKPGRAKVTHPHHIVDVLGLSDEDARTAEYEHIMPIAGKWLVGCKDIRQFHHWFPAVALPCFAELGMHLHVYACPDEAVKDGTYQLMFDPALATLIKSEPLDKPIRAA